MLLIAAGFFALHAVDLRADFPNHSAWMDWSKYTDEGWYGDAAIRHFQRGHWYVAGDFNPAAAMPIWPLMEAAVFHFTGVSLAAARALTVGIFGLTLVTVYLLIRRCDVITAQPDVSRAVSSAMEAGLRPTNRQASLRPASLAPAIAVLLLAVSPFCYVFTRLAILEPLLILLTLLALLTISYLKPPRQGSTKLRKLHVVPGNQYLVLVLLGLIVPLMVLTKTTAAFLLPSLGWLLWARAGYRVRPFLHLCFVPGVVATTTWLTYYFALVRPHYLLDYRYLFSANAYTGITAATAVSIFAKTISDGSWMGRLLFPLSLLATLLGILNRNRILRNPLVPALMFWASGYAAFLAYHNNLQPRYYLVIAVPLTMLVPIVFESLWQAPDPHSRHLGTQTPNYGQTHPIAAGALVVALLATLAIDARRTIAIVRTPEYTFVEAAEQIHRIITVDHALNPTHNPLVLSISGSNLSLMTGLASICDDFGTMDLPARVKTYNPGWFATWNQVDDDKMDALAPFYTLQRVAAFPAMDDPERNLLILYRLEPTTSPAAPTGHRRKPIPRLLQTRIGQQPSETQLEH
jgi:hypothetical protein